MSDPTEPTTAAATDAATDAPPLAPTEQAEQAAGAEPAPKKRKKKRAAGADVSVAIRVKDVKKRFGAKLAVDGISLAIPEGSVYGLIGPNGAGKTTTFSMLAGFLKPTEGEIEMLGYAPTQVDELRSRVGVLPQDAILPPHEKVGDFLVHLGKLQDIPADKLLDAVQKVLEEVDGKDWWSLKCGSLSHGMAKRVQLAQALLGDPDVVLLDEPTAGLDPRVAYEVRQIIKSRKGRCTLVVSSHNLAELEEVCDAAAILDRGRVIAEGTIGELTSASEEIHVQLAPGPTPLAEIRELPSVTRIEWTDETRELVVFFDRGSTDAEMVIGQVLWVLLQKQARISAVSKGKSLEQTVMDLT